MIQVDDDLFFAAMGDDDLEDEDFINHSCEPNCGIRGSLPPATIGAATTPAGARI